MRCVKDFKPMANKYLDFCRKKFPNGEGMDEIDMVRFVQAQSSSSYVGIQRPKKSRSSLRSFVKTLKSHAKPKSFNRSWMINHLEKISD